MYHQKICAFTLFILFSFSASAQQLRYDRLRIQLDQTHTISQLQQVGIAVDHGDFKKGHYFTTDLSEREELLVSNAGFTIEVLIHDVAAHYRNQNIGQSQTRSSRDLSCNAIQPIGTPANFTTGSMGGFYTYQEMIAVLDSMHAKFPTLISARQAIDTFTSIEGRPVYWLRISNHPDSTQSAKPQILYTALHHAREPAGLTNMVYYMWYLLENYNTSAEVKALVDNTEMYILPCVNPDGYIYNQTTDPTGGGMWRKNRRHNVDNSVGVDLNRNYGFNWGYDNVGSSNNTNDETFRGPASFSEPEIRAVRWFALQHRFRIAVNYHTYGNDLIYPWGYEGSFQTPDSALFMAYAKRMTKNNGFLSGTGDQTVGYVTNGDSDDWMYGEQNAKPKVFSMTPEAGSSDYGFWPPASAVIPICQENFDLIYSAHKFLLRYMEVTDLSDRVITQHQLWFKYNAQRLGLDSGATYTIHLLPIDPNVIVSAAVKVISDPALLAVTTDSLLVSLSSAVTGTTTFRFGVLINNGLYSYMDTITKEFITGDTIFYNDCNSVTAFATTGTWGTTTHSFTSPTASITDSPTGDYADQIDNTISLIAPVDLTQCSEATLLFKGKWALEKGYDYTALEVSTDNTTWSTLCGNYSNTNNSNAPSTNVYDGYQTDWVQEALDLTAYAHQKVYLRFHIVSDPALNYDGFYFDDLTALGKLDTTVIPTAVKDVTDNSDWRIFPDPAIDRVFVSDAKLNGEEVQIVDMLGTVSKRVRITNSQIDLQGLASGAYFVVLNKGEHPSIKRLVKLGDK